MASVYVLRYRVRHEGGGLVDHKAYLDETAADAAMERHRNEEWRFPKLTEEELEAGADSAVAEDLEAVEEYEATYGPAPSIHRMPVSVRSEFIASNSWTRSETIEVDRVSPQVRWRYDDYMCWIERLPLVADAPEGVL